MLLPARPPSPERRTLLPEDSVAFLIGLAGQERRVLELKEELERAESDLENLKRQWASNETSTRKNEIRHVEQFRPISKSVHGTSSCISNDLLGTAKEYEKQKPPSTNTKPSQRKVFSGSRHTRTLSLLSPKLPSSQQPICSQASAVQTEPRATVNYNLRSDKSIKQSSTSTNRPVFTSTASYNPLINPPKDAILETGKQFVGDFREGLWTFFEDLRQATVGDEAISYSDSRISPSSRNFYAAKKYDSDHKSESIDLASAVHGTKNADTNMALDSRTLKNGAFGSSEMEEGLHMEHEAEMSALSPTISSCVSQENLNLNESDDDGWDNWDTSKPKDSLPWLSAVTNTSNHAAYTPLDKSSQPKSKDNSSDENMRSGNLKCTAPTLMSVWERSLTPPGDEDFEGLALSRMSTPMKGSKAERELV